MSLDAIIIADCQTDTLYGDKSIPGLKIGDDVASIQNILEFIKSDGQLNNYKNREESMTWSSALYVNGVYLYNFLTEHDLKVKLINSYYIEKNYFLNTLESEKPKIIIISTTFIFSKEMLKKLIDDIRAHAPEIFIIVGGPFIYLSYLLLQKKSDPEYNTASAENDYMFLTINEEPSANLYINSPCGLKTLVSIINNLKENKPFNDIANLVFFKNGTYSFNEQINDFEVTTSKLNFENLPDSFFKSGVIAMQGSQGCPNNCYFCNFNKDRKILFTRPVDEIIKDLKIVAKKGIKYVCFVDDNFLLGNKSIEIFCKKLIEEDLGIKWFINLQFNTLKRVNFQLLKQAGCIEIYIGFESLDKNILNNMNKKSDPDAYFDILSEMLKEGINCSAGFIVGFPGETSETTKKIKDLIDKVAMIPSEGILTWIVWHFILMPMSPIYSPELRKKYELTGYKTKWKHNTMNSDIAFKHIMKLFFQINSASRMYWTDNLDLLQTFPRNKIKKFFLVRYELSKKAAIQKIGASEIIETFKFLRTD